MKSFVAALLVASASAFAPQQEKVASTTSLAAFESELGVQAPVSAFRLEGNQPSLLNERQECAESLSYLL